MKVKLLWGRVPEIEVSKYDGTLNLYQWGSPWFYITDHSPAPLEEWKGETDPRNDDRYVDSPYFKEYSL